MKVRSIALAVVVTVFVGGTARAEGDCGKLLVPDQTTIFSRDDVRLSYLHTLTTERYEEAKRDASLGATIPVDGIPLNATTNYADFQSKLHNESSRVQVDFSRVRTDWYYATRIPVDRGNQFVECMMLQEGGRDLRGRIRGRTSDDSVLVTLEFPANPDSVTQEIDLDFGESRNLESPPAATRIRRGNAVTLTLQRKDRDADLVFVVNPSKGRGFEFIDPAPIKILKMEPQFPIYVSNDMIPREKCYSRGDLCWAPQTTWAGVVLDRGVVYTQPFYGSNGHSHALIDIPQGARELRFSVGDYYTGADCNDPNKTPVDASIEVDGVLKWGPHRLTSPYNDAIPLSPDARQVKLIGNTSDGPVDCDDAVWINVGFR